MPQVLHDPLLAGVFRPSRPSPKRDDREGGELVGVTAPHGPRPKRDGAEARPPQREDRQSVTLPTPRPGKR